MNKYSQMEIRAESLRKKEEKKMWATSSHRRKTENRRNLSPGHP